MTTIKTAALLLAGLFATSAQAEFITSDWQAAGDNLVIENTTTGNQWLSLTATEDMSIAQVQAQLTTTFSGWRLPTRDEVNALNTALIGYTFGSLPVGGLFDRVALGFSRDTLFNAWSLMGDSHGDSYSVGMYLNDQPTGAEVLASGVAGHYWIYDNVNVGSTDSVDIRYSVYLIADGSAPSTPPAAVSAPLSSAALGLGLLAAGLRRRRG